MLTPRNRQLPGKPIQVGLLKNDGPFFKPTILGHEVVPSGYPSRQYHDFSSDAVERMGLVLLTLNGEAVLSTPVGQERLRRGSIFLGGLPCAAEIRLLKNARPWEFIYVLVRDAWPLSAFDWLRQRQGAIVHLPAASPVSIAFFEASKKLVVDAQCPTTSDLHTLSASTFSWFMKLLLAIEHGPELASRDRRNIEVPPGEIPVGCHTIKEFARQLRYSPSHLSRKLARTWQKAPGRALRLSRLEEASNLLRNTDLTVAEVASRCGYLSPSSFIRAFRLTFNQTPAHWRHQPGHSMPKTSSPSAPHRPVSCKDAPTTTSKRKRAHRRD